MLAFAQKIIFINTYIFSEFSAAVNGQATES